jgi:hypothetical protein
MTNDRDWGQRGQYPQESHGRLRPRNAQEAQRYDPRAHQQRISGQQNAPQGQPWPQRGPGLPPFPGQQQPAPQGWQQGYGQQPYMRQPQYAPPPPTSRPPSARPRRVSAPRKLPPYPAHLVRFPSGMLPRSRRRRHSIGHYVYLGTHPVALLIALWVNLMIICVVAGCLAFVAMGWMMWAMLVTMVWLVQVAAAALRR